eukprot:scaffold29160_cov73-Isochrysis_galbana.AAC.1
MSSGWAARRGAARFDARGCAAHTCSEKRASSHSECFAASRPSAGAEPASGAGGCELRLGRAAQRGTV